MEYVEVDGLRLAYRRRGSGPCLLLLHGGLCDGRVWRVELDSLSDEFTVIAWDAPGCGESSDPPDHFRLPDYAACLDGLIAQLGVGPAHLLGHSWGSSLALELFRLHSDAVRSLILAAAYAGWAGSLPPDEVARRLEFALAVADLAPGDFTPTSLAGSFTDAIPVDRAAELAGIMGAVRPSGTRAMARALAEADLRDVLPQISVPTLLLYGDADQRAPLDVAAAMRAAIPTSTLTVLPGVGHECFLEAPELTHRAVRDFLGS